MLGVLWLVVPVMTCLMLRACRWRSSPEAVRASASRSPGSWVRDLLTTHQHSCTNSLAGWLPAMCTWRHPHVSHQDACLYSGLHGAAVAITGRRDGVLQDAAAALQREGIRAHAIQVPIQAVTCAFALYLPCESGPLIMACFV